MKSKMLVAAVSAAIALVPVAAMAGVTVGGMAQGEIGYWKDTSNGAVASQGTNTTDNGAGRLWVSASQKLGYGLTGLAFDMFKVNTVGNGNFNTSPFGTGANAGEYYVGLRGGFGTIEIGKVASPYKYAGGVDWDAFLYTDLQARGNGGMAGGIFGQNGFMSDSIRYSSPQFSGFKIGVAYSPMNPGVNGSASNAGGASGPGTGMTAQHGDYSAALTWKAMGWDAVVAHDHAGTINGLAAYKPYVQLVGVGDGLTYATFNKAQNNTKFGLRYNFGPVAVMGQFENLDTAGQAAATHDIFVGVDGNVGHWAPIVQAGETTDKYYGPDVKASYVAVGAWYHFKKGFGIYGGYRRTQVSGVNTVVTTADPAAADGTQNVFSIGMRKVF